MRRAPLFASVAVAIAAAWTIPAGLNAQGSIEDSRAGNTRAEAMVHEIDQPSRFLAGFDVNAGGNLMSLRERFDESFYLTEGSDIVALLVLAHQTRVHNLITLAAEAAEEVLREQELMRLTAGVRLLVARTAGHEGTLAP